MGATALVAATPTPIDTNEAAQMDDLNPNPDIADSTPTTLLLPANPVVVSTTLVTVSAPSQDTKTITTGTYTQSIYSSGSTMSARPIPSHTYPPIPCNPDDYASGRLKLPKGFWCEPLSFGNNATKSNYTITWDPKQIYVGKKCWARENINLPDSWVCVKKEGKWWHWGKLERGYWRPVDCKERPEVRGCRKAGLLKRMGWMFQEGLVWALWKNGRGAVFEVVDELGRPWEEVGAVRGRFE